MALWVASPQEPVCLGWGWSRAGGTRNKGGGSGKMWVGGMVGPSRGRVWEHLSWWGEGVPLGTGCS